MTRKALDPVDSLEAIKVIDLLGTPQLITDYAGLCRLLGEWAGRDAVTAVEFCNTQIVSKRGIEPEFREATSEYDYFVPDGMPLVWCLRAMGIKMQDRVYGPTFMRYVLTHERELRHYFLGGSEETSHALIKQADALSGGRFQLAGASHRYWSPQDSPAIVAEINRLAPDVIWIGLGTPKQQEWVRHNKRLIRRGVLLTVGFAFDVNAGTKRDAPMWVQRLSLTWLFRISQEPSRLGGRYLKYNSWFLWLCFRDLVRYLVTLGKRSASNSR